MFRNTPAGRNGWEDMTVDEIIMKVASRRSAHLRARRATTAWRRIQPTLIFGFALYGANRLVDRIGRQRRGPFSEVLIVPLTPSLQPRHHRRSFGSDRHSYRALQRS
jgi:hypothetical protein